MNQKLKHYDVMKFPLYKKIIDDLQEFSDPVKTIRLYGFGEPLLNKSFCDMVRYAKNSDKVLNVDTTTNASLLTKDLNSNLIDSGIDRINVSIEAIGTNNYRKFTNNDSVVFDDIVIGIEDLFKRKTNLTLFVKINGDYLTEDEKERFYTIFKPISDGCDIEHTMNCWPDFEVKDVNTKVGIYGQPLEEVMVCPYIFYNFLIHADGHVSSCFLDWNKKMVIGDVKNESVKSLWNDKMLNKFRNDMLNMKRKEHPICKNCNQLIAGMPVKLDDHTEDILKRINHVQ